MAGAEIKITIDDQAVRAKLAEMEARLGNLTPAMEIIGQQVVTSVQRNFEAGGRPSAWAPLSWATLAKRGKKGKGGWMGMSRGKVLVRQGMAGGLLGSIHAKPEADKVTVGTDKIYAAVQQFGEGKGAAGTTKRGALIPWGNIPARPYLLVQDSDWPKVTRQLADYLMGK